MKDKLMAIITQFVKFGIVGVSNTLIHLGIYYALIYVGAHYILANTLGFVISVLNAYYWNNKYVFKSGRMKFSALLKVYTSYGGTFLISTVLLFLMVDIIGISALLAPIINMCITIPLNFILNKFWAFR